MRDHVYSSIWTVISEVNPGQKKLENVWGFFVFLSCDSFVIHIIRQTFLDPSLFLHLSEGSSRVRLLSLYFCDFLKIIILLSFHSVFISQVQIMCFHSVMAAVTRKTLNFKDNKVEKKS